MNRRLKLLLTVSTLLNLLLIGIIGGQTGHRLIGDEQHTMSEIAASLPADKRSVVLSVLEHSEQDTGELREQLMDARKKAMQILKADPFDKDAYFSQVQRINKLRDQLIQRKAEAIAELAPQLLPAEREKMAELMRHNNNTSTQPTTMK